MGAGGLLLALILVAGSGWAQETGMPAPGPAWVARTRVEPEVYRGACPATLNFVGEIEKGAWGLVEYHWARSDQTRTPIERIDFQYQSQYQGPRIVRVTMTWSVDPEPNEELWAELVIDSPRGSVSRAARAVAEVTCTNRLDPCAAIVEHGPITSLVQQCAEQRYEEAEARLSRLVDRFEGYLRPTSSEGSDAGGLREIEVKRYDAFRASQASWSQFRKQACQEVYLEFFLGSSAGARRLECLREVTEERSRHLERRLSSDE